MDLANSTYRTLVLRPQTLKIFGFVRPRLSRCLLTRDVLVFLFWSRGHNNHRETTTTSTRRLVLHPFFHKLVPCLQSCLFMHGSTCLYLSRLLRVVAFELGSKHLTRSGCNIPFRISLFRVTQVCSGKFDVSLPHWLIEFAAMQCDYLV